MFEFLGLVISSSEPKALALLPFQEAAKAKSSPLPFEF